MSNARNLSDLLGTGSTIATASIADDAITTAKVADDAITSALLATDSVGADAINLATNYLFTGRLGGDIPHGMAGHDNSTSFTGTTTLQGLANDLSSSDVTISTANNRLTPTVAGTYFCCAVHSFNGNGGSGYTPSMFLRKSGSVFVNSSFIESYASGHTEAHITIGIQHFNGSSEYLDSVHNHNAGTTMTSTGNGQTFMFRIKD